MAVWTIDGVLNDDGWLNNWWWLTDEWMMADWTVDDFWLNGWWWPIDSLTMANWLKTADRQIETDDWVFDSGWLTDWVICMFCRRSCRSWQLSVSVTSVQKGEAWIRLSAWWLTMEWLVCSHASLWSQVSQSVLTGVPREETFASGLKIVNM